MEHRWVMHVWSDGSASPWHTRNDELYRARYGVYPAAVRVPKPDGAPTRRECTPEELAEILEEQERFRKADER